MAAYDTMREDIQFSPAGYWPQMGIDYLYSPSRTHIAVFEEDANLNIYQGESPDDPGKKKVWSTGANLPSDREATLLVLRAGPFDHGTKNLQIFAGYKGGGTFMQLWASGGSRDLASPMTAVLGDDGNLTLRQNGQTVWSNGYSDPLVEFIVETIEYDLPRGTIKSDTESDVLEQKLHNGGAIDQSMKMSKSTSTSVTSTWSNATGFSATIGGEVTAGVPGVASAKVSMSASVSNTFTLGGSHSTTTNIGFDFNLNVPAGRTYRGWASVRQAEFEVPYTAVGELHFKSGRKIRHKILGTYQGKTGYLGVYNVEDVTDGNNKAVMFFADGPGKMKAIFPDKI
jgi:hypothetical protein